MTGKLRSLCRITCVTTSAETFLKFWEPTISLLTLMFPWKVHHSILCNAQHCVLSIYSLTRWRGSLSLGKVLSDSREILQALFPELHKSLYLAQSTNFNWNSMTIHSSVGIGSISIRRWFLMKVAFIILCCLQNDVDTATYHSWRNVWTVWLECDFLVGTRAVLVWLQATWKDVFERMR